jgi:hypothetical protein
MPNWRNDYRRCDNCRGEYRPPREAQSYCCRDCRRQAAYGRERFSAGTTGKRRRHLEASEIRPIEASETFPGSVVAGSFRNGEFSSIETIPCKPTKSPQARRFDWRGLTLVADDTYPHLYRNRFPDGRPSSPANLTRAKDAVRYLQEGQRGSPKQEDPRSPLQGRSCAQADG